MEADKGGSLLLDVPEYNLSLISVLSCVFNIYPVESNGHGISSISSTHKMLGLPKDEPHSRQIVGSGSSPPLSLALCLYEA